MRSPVAVKIAWQTAGKIGGNAGAPMPVGALLDVTQCTSMGGVCDIFTIGGQADEGVRLDNFFCLAS